MSGERVVAVEEGPTNVLASARVLDVGEHFVLPGAVDGHVHSLSHDHEGIAASTAAAAAGGVTTIIEMPFDGAGPINSRDRLLAKQDLAAAEAHVDVALLGTLAPEGGWRAAEELAAHGVVGYKVSTFLTDPRRFPRIPDGELVEVMAAVRETGRTLCVHAENNEVITHRIAQERARRADAGEDGLDPQAHTRTRPPVAETLGVLTVLELAATTDARVHVCHASLPRSVELIRWYQSQGTDVTVETCPHYLTFTAADLDRQGARLKINPPLRDDAAREGMWDRLARRDIALITSDHAPWPVTRKDAPYILDNSSGIPGTQTLVAVTLGTALRRDPSLALFTAAVDALTRNPAARYGIADRKGHLGPGADADLMVFAPDAVSAASEAHVIRSTDQRSNAGWTPYDGLAPGGQVTHTILRGRLIHSADAGLQATPGIGTVIAGTAGGAA